MWDVTALANGYYWARHDGAGDEFGTTFIVLRENQKWYICGVNEAINDTFRETQIICPVKRPDH